MKNKKYLFILILVLLIAVVFCFLQYNKLNSINNVITEYTPQEEISEEQARQSLVTLYFINKEDKTIMPEARLIDARLLATNPYSTLVSLLINGPKNEKLESPIPQGTRLNSVRTEKNMAIVDLSSEFIKDVKLGAEEESKIVYTIVNTLVELTEIDSVKILIDGKENQCFEDEAINFKQPFVRMD